MWMIVCKLVHFLCGPKYFKTGYFVHSVGNKHVVCKILNEYDNCEEASAELVKLLTKRKTEKELLRDFQTKKSW